MRSTKIMLLGIALMILGFWMDEYGGILDGDKEFFIVIGGFLITLIGLFKKDKPNKS